MKHFTLICCAAVPACAARQSPMRAKSIFCITAIVLGIVVAAVRAQDPASEPVLHRRIDIPAQLLQQGSGSLYGGDVRMGDLTGNGEVDFVVFRSAGPEIKTCFVGAFDGEGRYLWHVGAGGRQPTRPGSVAIHDWDGDGQSEVICLFQDRSMKAARGSFADMTVRILDGATGRVKQQTAPAKLTEWTNDEEQAGTHGNWAHQRIVIGNFRGRPTPQDFVIKLGFDYLAFDHELNLLWSHSVPPHGPNEHCSYIPDVGDVDGDGKDEVFGGQVLINHDGRRLWYEIKA